MRSIPPFIIGRKELPLAPRLNDKLLHTDALMNKANWMTGAAGIAGIRRAGARLVVGGLAGGGGDLGEHHQATAIDALRAATAELIDGMPRALDCKRRGRGRRGAAGGA